MDLSNPARMRTLRDYERQAAWDDHHARMRELEMNTNGTAPKTTIEGVVIRANGNGVKLDTYDGWINWSKFAPLPWQPEIGVRVSITRDRSGFIREMYARSETTADKAPDEAAAEAASEAPPTPKTEPTRDRVVTRQWAVNAAIAFLSSGDASIEDIDGVLKIAAKLETWALRSA